MAKINDLSYYSTDRTVTETLHLHVKLHEKIMPQLNRLLESRPADYRRAIDLSCQIGKKALLDLFAAAMDLSDMRSALVLLVALFTNTCLAWGQDLNADDVQKGHRLAILVCAYCHVAAPDQDMKPFLQPPAASFESIAQQKTFTVEWLRTFLNTTHRGLDNPKGMPNPQLLDFELKELTAYFLSLQKNP